MSSSTMQAALKVRFRVPVMERVAAVAALERVPRSEVIRRAVEAYVLTPRADVPPLTMPVVLTEQV